MTTVAGIEIYTPDGVEMISSNMINYVVADKGTATTGTPPSDGNWASAFTGYVTVARTCYAPVMFVRCETARAIAVPLLTNAHDPTGVTSTTHTWQILTDGSGAHDVEWWIMDTANNGIRYGGDSKSFFELYNEAGIKTFDASMRSFKNAYVTANNQVTGSGDRGSYTRPSGRVYAHSRGVFKSGWKVASGVRYYEYVGMRHDDNVLYWGPIRGSKINNGVGDSDYILVDCSFVIIDVTDLY